MDGGTLAFNARDAEATEDGKLDRATHRRYNSTATRRQDAFGLMTPGENIIYKDKSII